jgi:hypothetical protein
MERTAGAAAHAGGARIRDCVTKRQPNQKINKPRLAKGRSWCSVEGYYPALPWGDRPLRGGTGRRAVKEVVHSFGDGKKKATVIEQLNDVDHRLPAQGCPLQTSKKLLRLDQVALESRRKPGLRPPSKGRKFVVNSSEGGRSRAQAQLGGSVALQLTARLGRFLRCSGSQLETRFLGLDPVGEIPRLETGWLGAGLRRVRVKRYRQRSGEAEAGSAGDGGTLGMVASPHRAASHQREHAIAACCA